MDSGFLFVFRFVSVLMTVCESETGVVMAQDIAVVSGQLHADGSLELDEKPKLPPGRVQVTLQVLPESNMVGPIGWWEALQQIKTDQEGRGYAGRSQEEMAEDEADRRAEDDDDEARWRKIWEQTRKHPSKDKS